MNTIKPALLLCCLLALPGQAQEGRSNQLDATFEHSSLTNGSPTWSGMELRLSHQLGRRHAVAATLRETRRFGQTDTQLTGDYAVPLNEHLALDLDTVIIGTHRIPPLVASGVSLQYAFHPAWLVHVGQRPSARPAHWARPCMAAKSSLIITTQISIASA